MNFQSNRLADQSTNCFSAFIQFHFFILLERVLLWLRLGKVSPHLFGTKFWTSFEKHGGEFPLQVWQKMFPTVMTFNFWTLLFTCIHSFWETKPRLDLRSTEGLMLYSNMTWRNSAWLPGNNPLSNSCVGVCKLQKGAAETQHSGFPSQNLLWRIPKQNNLSDVRIHLRPHT